MFCLRILIICITAVTSSCVVLKTPKVLTFESLNAYKYVYIPQTKEITKYVRETSSSATGGIYANKLNTTTVSQEKSFNPRDIIIGKLIKEGYVVLQTLEPELLSKTLIVNYAESGRRELMFDFAIEVTIQFVSAETNNVVCITTAEGDGYNENDDIRQAIYTALSSVFPE